MGAEPLQLGSHATAEVAGGGDKHPFATPKVGAVGWVVPTGDGGVTPHRHSQ